MRTFTASLRAIGDVRGLPATVEIADGRMTIAAGSTPIGEWSLEDIDIEPTPTGYRVAAEGEQILVELQDLDGFADALARNARKTRFRRKSIKLSKTADTTTAQEAPPGRVTSTEESDTVAPRTVKPKRSKRERRAKQAPVAVSTPAAAAPRPSKTAVEHKRSNRFVRTMDQLIERAEKRWESLLPPWVFSRGMFLALAVFLLLTIFFPATASAAFLILGGLVIAFGGVAYSDEIVAAKWLPGRSTPAHLLIGGVGLVILGILVGLISR